LLAFEFALYIGNSLGEAAPARLGYAVPIAPSREYSLAQVLAKLVVGHLFQIDAENCKTRRQRLGLPKPGESRDQHSICKISGRAEYDDDTRFSLWQWRLRHRL